LKQFNVVRLTFKIVDSELGEFQERSRPDKVSRDIHYISKSLIIFLVMAWDHVNTQFPPETLAISML